MNLTENDINFLKIAEEISYKVKQSINNEKEQQLPETQLKKKTMLYKDVIEKYRVEKFPYENETTKVAVLTGDVFIDGFLHSGWIKEQVSEIGRNGYMTLIDGNITIKGELVDNGFSFLFITGNVICDSIFSNDGAILIKGDAIVKFGIYGDYNDGHIVIGGKTETPYILSNDHQASVQCVSDTIYIDHFCNERNNIAFQNFKDYSYFKLEDAASLLKPEVWDENGEFDRNKFFDIVSSGENPFIKY